LLRCGCRLSDSRRKSLFMGPLKVPVLVESMYPDCSEGCPPCLHVCMPLYQ
jgi:hypothetical protein